MKAGIYTNLGKDKDLSVTRRLLQSLSTAGIDCYAHESLAGNVLSLGYFSERDELDFDIVLALGGDGTMLSIAKWCAVKKIPLLGINMGKLGFLTEAEPTDFDALAQAIARKNYTVERRTMLCAETADKRTYALNEIVVSRKSISKMIMAEVDIGGKVIDRHYCDGFIVSTPTGSTAYSLSAGGPVVSPTANVFALTPINSHSMHSRPIVIGDDEQVGIRLVSQTGDATVIADGKTVCSLPARQRIHIRKAPRRALFVRLHDSSFYERLLRKLNTWSTVPEENIGENV